MRDPALAPQNPTDSAHASLAQRLAQAWRERTLILKATAFALIGVVNTIVDYTVFLLARMALQHSPAALAWFGSFAASCHCGSPDTVLLIAANMMSWTVGVSGSYIMNSRITFAAESGRKLSWQRYLTFVVSGIAGLIANTAALVFAAQVLFLPVWVAKGCAILASFVVNFSMSHFVVFRVRGGPADDAGEGV
jgi:putative flippase GtrA